MIPIVATTPEAVLERRRRIEAANVVTSILCRLALVWIARKGLFVRYPSGTLQRWATVPNNPFVPAWRTSNKTSPARLAMLSQLCRWVLNRPVLGLDYWRYWLSVCDLPDRTAARVIHALADAGYPSASLCGRCGTPIPSAATWLLATGPVCPPSTECPKRVPGDETLLVPIP